MIAQDDPKERSGNESQGDNNPQKAIDTPGEVEESNDEKIDQDFPGYPHYPAKDDILNPENNSGQVDIDVEKLSRSNSISPAHLEQIKGTPELEPDFTQVPEQEGEEIEFRPTSDADVTAEDLAILGPRDQDMDMDEDEDLMSRGWQPVTGKDLDVPDADFDGNEALGQEDEENSYYSLGGDERENLRENDDQNNF